MWTSITDLRSFESLLKDLQAQDWALQDHALKNQDLLSLKSWAQAQKSAGLFNQAQMGRGSERQHNPQVRGDSILWLEPSRSQLSLFAYFEELRSELNQQFFLGLQNFEMHLAHYGPGAFYQEHLDQSPQVQPLLGERVISFVLYLNDSWQPGDGGELVLSESQQKIEPLFGRLVIFRSDTVLHQVLLAHKERWSLTGWFRRSRL